MTTREYYDVGEYVPGSTPQPYYYGIDQFGSVRRSFASAGAAPAYGYDPYGNALQGTASLTDFGYAGMFYNVDSGLYLTQYRAYDPVAGRWLSRDPIDEMSSLDSLSAALSNAALVLQTTSTSSFVRGTNRNSYQVENQQIQGINFVSAANLYYYVAENPVAYVDPDGDQWANVVGAAAGFIGGVTGNLLQQGIQQSLSGMPCPPPINIGQALLAGLAGGVVGFTSPTTGVTQFIAPIMRGIAAGTIVGIGAPAVSR